MRILILTQWFDPEPTFKGLVFARELKRRGHDVEVLTGFPNYPGGKVYPGYRIRLLQKEEIDGIRINRVALIPSHDQSAIRRILNYGSFALSAAIMGSIFVSRPDVIYVYHPPATIGIPALVLSWLRWCPIVYDVQDLWPDTVAATGMMSNRSALKVLDWFCRFVYRSANRLVVLSPGFLQILSTRGIAKERIRQIYNWTDEGSIQTDTSIQPVDESIAEKLVGRFNIMFAGTMGIAQALDAVLDAAKLCQERVPQAQFVFVGGGVDRERLIRCSEEMQLTNVVFLPRQPMQAMGRILNLANVLLVHLKDDPLFRITIPSKTQAYLAAGKPILMAVGGDAADLVNQSGGGLTCSPENAGEIAECVRTMFLSGTENLREMGRRGKEFYDKQLSLRTGVNQFEEIFYEVTNLKKPESPLAAENAPHSLKSQASENRGNVSPVIRS